MIEPRLSSEMTVQALLRKVNQEGGFGVVIRTGYPGCGTAHRPNDLISLTLLHRTLFPEPL